MLDESEINLHYHAQIEFCTQESVVTTKRSHGDGKTAKSVDAQTGILLTQGSAGIPETLSALPVLDQRADALEECDLAASGKARVADSTVQAIDRDSRMQDTISEAFLLMSPRSQHSVLNSLLAQYANSRVLL